MTLTVVFYFLFLNTGTFSNPCRKGQTEEAYGNEDKHDPINKAILRLIN